MLISDFVENVRQDFKNLAVLADAETAAIVERIGAAVEPALQQHLLEALNLLIQEFNVDDSAPLRLEFQGDEVRVARLATTSTDDSVPTSDYSARIALRLSDDLKESIEHLATDVGSSVNSWIVRSLERSVRSDPSGGFVSGRRQLRGKGRA